MTMSRGFRTYLLVTATGAAVAIIFPPVVWFGLLFGILPGLFLIIAPSLFAYSAAWWALKALILEATALMGISFKRWMHLSVGAAAIGPLVAIAFLVPDHFNAAVEETVAELRKGDLELDGPISIPDVVAVILAREPGNDGLCEALCQRLLFNYAASRVIVAAIPSPMASDQSENPAKAFWIERRNTCPAPPLSKIEIAWPGDNPRTINRIRARIAAGECLLSETGHTQTATLTITYRILQRGPIVFPPPWSLRLDQMKVTRLEIAEDDNRLIYRRTGIEAQPLKSPLQIETRSSFMTTVTYAGWARFRKSYSELDIQGRDVLPSLLGEAVRQPEGHDSAVD